MTAWRLALAMLLVAAAPAGARVVTSAADGFVVSDTVVVAKPPAAVWAALLEWGRWWSPDHSYSGKAANFTLVPRAGGTLVEAWDGQSVLHAGVVTVMPNRLLRLQGGFGPLQALPVSAILDYTLASEGAGTKLSFTYRVGGPADADLPALAAPVDTVMTAALGRLARYATTGKP